MDCLSRVKTLPSYGRSFNFPHFFFDTSFSSSTKSHQFFQRPKIFIVGPSAALAKFEQNIEKDSGFSFASLLTSLADSVKGRKEEQAPIRQPETYAPDPDEDAIGPQGQEMLCQNRMNEFTLDGRRMVFLHPKPWVIEISSASITIYSALEYAMEQFHLQPEHILYFGVSDKDNPAIQRTCGIAIKGSPASTSQCAMRTTKYNGAQNGIGYMINVLRMDKTCIFCKPEIPAAQPASQPVSSPLQRVHKHTKPI